MAEVAGSATTADSRAATDYQPDPRRWKALAVCLIAGFMTLLDISIVNVALPSIRTGLHAGPSDIQWIVAGYTLAFGLVLVPAGRIGDAKSRRVVFGVGLVVFTLCSGLAGAATGPTWLSIARIAQGIGAGIVSPQVAGFIQSLFRGAERGKAFGLFGATIGLSTAIGPLLGGALILAFGKHEGWRFVFYVNLPIGAFALALIHRYLPADVGRRRRQGLDPVGVLLLAGGTLLVMLPLVTGDQTSLASRSWWLEPIAGALLVGFVLWERRVGRRGGQPVVDLHLFTLRSFGLGTSLAMVYFAGFTSLFLVLTLYLQTGLHYSALLAGLTGLPFAIGSGSAAAIGGRVVHRYGRIIVVSGLFAVVAGLIATDLLVSHVHTHVGAVIAAPLLVAGIGSGLTISPNQTLTLAEVAVAGGGSGAGVMQTAQRIGTSIGVAVVTAVFFTSVASHHGGFAAAFSDGLWVTIVLVAAALVIGIADLLPKRSTGRHAAA